jgi:hypothetical protein
VQDVFLAVVIALLAKLSITRSPHSLDVPVAPHADRIKRNSVLFGLKLHALVGRLSTRHLRASVERDLPELLVPHALRHRQVDCIRNLPGMIDDYRAIRFLRAITLPCVGLSEGAITCKNGEQNRCEC